MMTPDRFDMLNHHIEMLSMMLQPMRWHGTNIIFAGPFIHTPTVREMFEALVQDIAGLNADNDRLLANETTALDRMKRAEDAANVAMLKVRNREETIERLRAALRQYADEGNWMPVETGPFGATDDAWMGDGEGWLLAQKALKENL